METALYIIAVWFGLGGLGTLILLGVCTAFRRSRERADLPLAVCRVVAQTRQRETYITNDAITARMVIVAIASSKPMSLRRAD